MATEDFKLCRLCLGKSASISVFSTSAASEDGTQYYHQIVRCARVEIAENDGLPSAMCVTCEAELALSYRFLLKCESSDSALRNIHLTLLGSAGLDIKQEQCDDSFDLEDMKNEYYDTEELSNDRKREKKHGKRRLKRKERVEHVRKGIKREKLGPRPCPTCGLLVNSRSAMEIHSRTHTGEKPYICHDCGVAYGAKGTLKRHVETHHLTRERKFTCETCGSRFYRKNDIVIHMRRHTGEKPYACPFCPVRFQQIASLIRHKRTHTGDKPYSCPVCAKPFADKSMVTKHMSVHSDERKYSCHLCDKSVKTKTALNNHLKLHSNEKLNVCNFCGMAFAAKGNLRMHIRRVHSDKSGQCGVCNKTFSDLAEHMHKHTGARPHECSKCGRAFASKKSLTNHVMFRHENAHKYKCTVEDCDRFFPAPSMLRFHLLKYHTNHTPFVCQHCSRGFFRSSDLSRHLRVSHPQQHNDTHKQEITLMVS